MIHIIDKQSDEIVGIIPPNEFWDDNYHRSLETTAETFEFTTFADRDYSEYLTGRNKVIIPDEDGGYRELTIWQAEKVHEHSKHIVVFTKASYNDLRKAQVIKPQTLKSQSASTAAATILRGTEWSVGLVEGKGSRTIHVEKHTDPYSMLKRIATEFDLELDFRIETKGNKITGRYVDLVQQIGQWRGREIEFGKDLRSIKRIEDTDNIYTALIGLGPEKDGRRLEVLVEDYDALQRWGRRDPVTGELRHIISTYEPQTEKDELSYDRLRTLTKNELEKRINEVIEYEAEIADLEHVPGMENEKIRFGDTLKIKDTQFNPPLYVEARVFEVSGSIKERGKKNVKLGDFTEYTEQEVIAVWQSLQDEIRRSIARMLSVNVVSSAGTVFKNGIGSTELTAVVYNQGNETDASGETYEYTWTKYDKHGNFDADWTASGKKITVQASDIDEKAMYACEVVFQDVAVLGYVTLTNVFDGKRGPQGPNKVDNNTEFADGYDPSTKETPEGAQEKAEEARRQAEEFAENASNIKKGIIDVGSVPIRTAANGARIQWDGTNGLVQYDSKGNPVSWLDLKGNSRFVNAYLSGEIHAKRGVLGDGNVIIDERGVRIVRPDGAIAMQNGLSNNDHPVFSSDPHYMTGGRVKRSGVRFEAFRPGGTYIQGATQIYGGVKGSLDGRGLDGSLEDYEDVRDGIRAVAFNKYEFTHSAKYLVFRFRKYAGAKFSVHVMKDTSDNINDRLYFELLEKDVEGLKNFIVDLGVPKYDTRVVTFKIGWTSGWGNRMENMRFVMEKVYLTDFV
ncbi:MULTISPECIES: phage tail spike protein [unclassified Virgibacillus]|uniref:phage tail spike protein n=1 Tax=unclassified Virgibacillus TaxID=2620237 RepID=UPI00090973FA|nr:MULTISPECIES: phage tail spike protein [unclassified Virgibacillus]API92723.1 hypothetical protein BKP57_13445 [Virgibacillus sp. 6R]MBS7428219.1 phage tail protein [Virgibacillus sp. 19R1-5]